MESSHVHAAIDEPLAQQVIDSGRLRIRGWVFDERAPLDRVILVVGRLPPVAVTVGAWRADVDSEFEQLQGSGASGFHCDVDLRGTAPGQVPVALLARSADGDWHQPAARTIEVTNRPGATPRRGAAAFTIAQNEPAMLPLWVRYYEKHFAADDLYVLDHDSTDRSADAVAGRCRIVPVHRTASFDHRWLRGTVEAFQAFLLRSCSDSVYDSRTRPCMLHQIRRERFGIGLFGNQIRHGRAQAGTFHAFRQKHRAAVVRRE